MNARYGDPSSARLTSDDVHHPPELTSIAVPACAQRGWGAGLRGATPLHFAAENGNVGMAAALVAAGARVDATDGEGLAPLHYAAEAMNAGKRGPVPLSRDAERNERLLAMLELLCDAGANPLQRTNVRARCTRCCTAEREKRQRHAPVVDVDLPF